MENNTSRDFKQLTVWQKSMDLVMAIQDLTGYFPNIENYGAISQIRNLSVSISTNIAAGKNSNNEKERYESLVKAKKNAYDLEFKMKEIKKLPFGQKLDFSEIEELLSELVQELNKVIKKTRDKLL